MAEKQPVLETPPEGTGLSQIEAQLGSLNIIDPIEGLKAVNLKREYGAHAHVKPFGILDSVARHFNLTTDNIVEDAKLAERQKPWLQLFEAHNKEVAQLKAQALAGQRPSTVGDVLTGPPGLADVAGIQAPPSTRGSIDTSSGTPQLIQPDIQGAGTAGQPATLTPEATQRFMAGMSQQLTPVQSGAVESELKRRATRPPALDPNLAAMIGMARLENLQAGTEQKKAGTEGTKARTELTKEQTTGQQLSNKYYSQKTEAQILELERRGDKEAADDLRAEEKMVNEEVNTAWKRATTGKYISDFMDQSGQLDFSKMMALVMGGKSLRDLSADLDNLQREVDAARNPQVKERLQDMLASERVKVDRAKRAEAFISTAKTQLDTSYPAAQFPPKDGVKATKQVKMPSGDILTFESDGKQWRMKAR